MIPLFCMSQQKMKRNLALSAIFVLILLFSAQSVSAESKYTREKSEELFHLINWQEYKPETFDKALKEQKPIFLVISAPAWCYWCHVYESEDYLYHPKLYPYLNENFVMVFVDSDKRPDLTRKYLEGGWPSTTIFTPDIQRIAGFTGPRDPSGLVNYLKQVVTYVSKKEFTNFTSQINYQETPPIVPNENYLMSYEEKYLQSVEQAYDSIYGGVVIQREAWGEGQKISNPFTYKYLLEEYEETENKKYLDIVAATFNNQYTDINDIETRYRLYDPIEGGFHRYSTKRDWSIPHYEKMLYDQAKLLRAYFQLYNITGDKNVKTAVDGTISFILNKFYDSNGGFYSSQDAYLEEKYFGLSQEERGKIEPPHIDQTRLISGNSMMISTFLYLYDKTRSTQYKEVAQQSLDFMRENMVGEDGAYYYFDYEKQEAFLTGQSISNSWSLLAFADGYGALKDDKYLQTAKEIADYSLTELYDWNSGGFFERHSKDTMFYAPNERIDLSKPFEENAVFTYGMLKLYLITGNLEYLEAGIKTLGYLSDKFGGLDETYYFLESIKIIKDNNLLAVYNNNQRGLNDIIKVRKATFFVDELVAQQQKIVSIDDAPKLQSEFANAGFLLLAVLALFAGLLSFLSPCCLPVLSAYFAHNINTNKGEMVKNTIFFFLGLATVFSIFGMGATLIGSLFRENRLIFTQLAGAIIIIFGLLEIFGKGFSGLHIHFKGNHKTPIGSYLFGAVFALGWSACIGPILASLLLLAATSGTIAKGTVLLFIYALGLSIPLLLISFYFDKIKTKRFWKILQGRIISFKILRKEVSIHTTYLISGIILIILGLLIFNDYLFKLNQIALQTDFVQNVVIRGEEFLKKAFIR